MEYIDEITAILEEFKKAPKTTDLFGEISVNVTDIENRLLCGISLKSKFFRKHLDYLKDKNCFLENDPTKGLSQNGIDFLEQLLTRNHS